MKIHKRGYELIRDPSFNKGTAFTHAERHSLGLVGLLPPHVNSQAQQASRVLDALRKIDDPLRQYVSLASLQDRNEQLFYYLLEQNLSELMPIVYTPTVGLATQNFSQVFQRGRGVWITLDSRGSMEEVLRNAVGERDIQLSVVTDNESILGIGDQGAGGMAISVGKLSLYVAAAGIAPQGVLPISLDVGTNNPQLLDDPLYLGWPNTRLTGDAYRAFIEEFVAACQVVMPHALIQWEDFRKDNALELLDRYRGPVLSFNDDIQGTGAVALAGVLTGLRGTGQTLSDQRIAIYGAGAAGLGIARQIHAALLLQGCSSSQARERIGVFDSRGLIVDDKPLRDAYKAELAWPLQFAQSVGISEDRSLSTVIGAWKPTVLIGTSGQAGAFDEFLVREMASGCDQPIIMPFSNPTANAEATPEQLLAWTNGTARIATGSPFAPVAIQGRQVEIGQGNNVFIFPGLGLGALACQATQITDNMVSVASKSLAESVTQEEIGRGLLFPAIPRLREVSLQLAQAVVEQAIDDGVACVSKEAALAEIQQRWSPVYEDYQAN